MMSFPGGPLYPTHFPLGSLQKAAVGVLSAAGALFNPGRGDLVAAVSEVTGTSALREIHERMLKSPTGREVLVDRPRINNMTMEHARNMPDGSFGRAYASFMDGRGFQADERPPVRFVDDYELAYVATRYRELHDLWHVLFGCPTTLSGEIALKAVEYLQTGLPMTALAVMGAPYRLNKVSRDRLFYQQLPWAIRASVSSQDLMCLYYEKHFEEDFTAVRRKWGITVAPRFK